MKHWSLWLLFGISLLFGASCGKEPEPQPLPQPVKVTGVTMNSTSLTLVEGETAELVATISPKNADNQTVLWSSSDGSVASVDNGKVTALKAGKATITAKSDDGGFTATCSITVNPKTVEVTSVTLSKEGLALTEGESETLIATVNPEDATDKSITWSSSDTSIVTVEEGKVTALKEGVAAITAMAGDKSATCMVTVAKKIIEVESIELSNNTLDLTEGDTETLVATVKPDNATDKTVQWRTSDKSIATVSDNGLVTALKAGNVTITASCGDKSDNCNVTINPKEVPVSSVTLSSGSLTLTVGESASLVATVLPENASDKTVIWSSSNTSVATVDNTGKVTGSGSGSSIITASCGGKTAMCNITVKPATVSVTGVSLDHSTLSMTEGDTQALTATVFPSNATNKSVTWSSDNNTVATVSSSGVVSANAAGSAKITVRTNDGGKTAECYITVSPAEQYVVFEDAIFKAFCVDRFDENNDGIISIAEAATVTDIYVGNKNISSLKGIEYFTSLSYLNCGFNQLTSLDLSNNIQLRVLDCSNNQLTNLDVSKNTQLGGLTCSDNKITSLDVSNNLQLNILYCDCNQLTSLDVSKNTLLRDFYCNNNQLTSLDVSKNTLLQKLVCYKNQLTSLDVSKNTDLFMLGFGQNLITSIDVSNNLLLTQLSCSDNKITSLDVSNNTGLKELYCNDNQLTSLDVSNNTELKLLWCYSNPNLTEIWFKKGQIIADLRYNWDVSIIKYKD